MLKPTYQEVRALLDSGHTRKEVETLLDLTKGQVSGLIFRATSPKYEHRGSNRVPRATLINALENVLRQADPAQSDARYAGAWLVLEHAA